MLEEKLFLSWLVKSLHKLNKSLSSEPATKPSLGKVEEEKKSPLAVDCQFGLRNIRQELHLYGSWSDQNMLW